MDYTDISIHKRSKNDKRQLSTGTAGAKEDIYIYILNKEKYIFSKVRSQD